MSFTPEQIFYRFILAKGKEIFQKLQQTVVLVLNLNQTGCLIAEILARCSIGTIILVDDSAFQESDIHGYFLSNKETIGYKKAEVAGQRIKDINPSCNVFSVLESPNQQTFIQTVLKYSPMFSIDCTEDMNVKQEICKHCIEQKINLITTFCGINMCDPRLIVSSPLNRVHHNIQAKQLKKQLNISDDDFYNYIMAIYSMEIYQQKENNFLYGPVQNMIAINCVNSVINAIAEGQLVNPKDNKQYQPRHKNIKQ